MSSRRPLSRSYSGNGRSSSQNGEQVSAQGSRMDSRGFLHSVRPENRSTLCSVMAQLTEETQPSFETTLKSKAVSESCNVKFTCVVTGYPVPELTWYKDDVEMDRYCGLPKYEIFRNGKTHTLHIYNCTLEDAAIYQVSARNSKGIVSCSGVLEVGTMNEYQIHQRFFAKLKQKAENKKKELEDSRQQNQDDVQSAVKLDPSQRKHWSPGETSSLVVDGGHLLKTQDSETAGEADVTDGAQESAQQAEGITEVRNGFPVVKENANQALTYIYETVEVVNTRQTNKESLDKKKMKISNGVGSEKGKVMSEDCQNSKDVSKRGVSMTESLQTEASEDKERSAEKAMEVGSPHPSPADKEIQKHLDESDKATRHNSAGEEESPAVTSKQKESSSTQSPLTSMFFSLRDIFFGSKNKSGVESGDSLDTASSRDVKQDEKKSSTVPSKLPQQKKNDRTEKCERVSVKTPQMKINDKVPSKDNQVKRTTPAIVHCEDPVKQGSLNPNRLKQKNAVAKGTESVTKTANKPHEAQAAAEQRLNEQNMFMAPAEETDIIPRYTMPPQLQSPCAVKMDTTAGKGLITTSTPPGMPPPVLQEGFTQDISETSALPNKSLSSFSDESYSNALNKEKKVIQTTAESEDNSLAVNQGSTEVKNQEMQENMNVQKNEGNINTEEDASMFAKNNHKEKHNSKLLEVASALGEKKDNLSDCMKTQEYTCVCTEVKDEVKENEKAVGQNQLNETERIPKIKPENEYGSIPVKSCEKFVKIVLEGTIPESEITESNLKSLNNEAIITVPDAANVVQTWSNLEPPNKEGVIAPEAETKEPTGSNLETYSRDGIVRAPKTENKDRTESVLEPPKKEGIVQVPEAENTESTESNQEPSNECNARVPENKENTVLNVELPCKDGIVRIHETEITEPIETNQELTNNEGNAVVSKPGTTNRNESNQMNQMPSKEGTIRIPESKLEPSNRENNVRLSKAGITDPSELSLETPNKEGVVGVPEAAVREFQQLNLKIPIKEDFVKVPKVGITEPIESKVEPPSKESHVKHSESRITGSSESNMEAPKKKGPETAIEELSQSRLELHRKEVPEAGFTEFIKSKSEPSSKECDARAPNPGITEANESNLEALDKEGNEKVPETGITKQGFSSSQELPNKELFTPELKEQEKHDNVEPLEYLANSTCVSERSQIEESQMSSPPLRETVLTDSYTGVPMVLSAASVVQNDKDEAHHPKTESTSEFNRQKEANKNTPEKHSRFMAETDNDLFNVLSLDAKADVSKESGKKDANMVTPTLKSLANLPGLVAPPISVTFVESICEKTSESENQMNKVQSLVGLLREVKSDLDTERLCVSSSLGSKKENSSFTQCTDEALNASHTGVTDSSAIVPLGLLTPEQISSPSQPVSAPSQFPKKTAPLVGGTEPEGNKPAPKCDSVAFICHLQKDKSAAETSGPTVPQTPLLSPSTMRRSAAKGISYLHSPSLVTVPTIQIESASCDGKPEEGQSANDAMVSCESGPRLKRTDSLTLIPSATPEELASGARRKIFISKTKGEEAESTTLEAQAKWDDMTRRSRTSVDQDSQYMSPGQSRRSTFLQTPTSQQTPPLERRSPLLPRKKATLEVPKEQEKSEETDTTKTDSRSAEKTNPFKAPQVIRKIRGEPFSDATGHLKLWCQFFNVLGDSTIKWHRDEVEIAEMERRSGDESQVALAIVQASSRDCGVYSCTIRNEYGMDSTDFLLSAEILSAFILHDDLEAGEEIEMTPMVFSKGLADSGHWGGKLFGRIMIQEVHVGEGCAHKACKVKVIYGLEPVFESGSTCVVKVRNPIPYGTREENNLIERNLEITKEECKTQNLIRQYCNVFAAEARVLENFGPALEIIPLYLMYRPANTVPYATVEADLRGIFLRYCLMDSMGRLIMRNVSEVEQKCCAFQHWIFQFTNGNLLVTHLEGVGMKITNVKIATKSKGYQGLSESAKLQVFQQFAMLHQCNQYCGLLGLHSLKTMDSLQQPTKPKGSRSPLAARKMASGSGSSSPQQQKKGALSPQAPRKVSSSPKIARKSEAEESKSGSKHKTVEVPKPVRMR